LCALASEKRRVHLALEDAVKWTRREISTSMCGCNAAKSAIVSGEPHQQASAAVGCCCTAQNGHGRPRLMLLPEDFLISGERNALNAASRRQRWWGRYSSIIAVATIRAIQGACLPTAGGFCARTAVHGRRQHCARARLRPILEEQVGKCDALLAVIGKGWIDARDDKGARRLDNPDDFVRIEIESALKQDKRVIPVLVGDTRMPRPEELPEAIRPLARRNAVRLSHERFRADGAGPHQGASTGTRRCRGAPPDARGGGPTGARGGASERKQQQMPAPKHVSRPLTVAKGC
jgi:hypothetical protein